MNFDVGIYLTINWIIGNGYGQTVLGYAYFLTIQNCFPKLHALGSNFKPRKRGKKRNTCWQVKN